VVLLPHFSFFRGTEDVSWKIEDILEELVQHQEPESLQSYLDKVKFKTVVIHVCPPDMDKGVCNFLLANITLPVTSRVFSKLCSNTCEEKGYPSCFLDTHFVYSYTDQEAMLKLHS